MDLLTGLWPPLIPWARALVALEPGVRVTSGYRSYQQQSELYEKWKRLRGEGLSNDEIARQYGLYTPAPPGRSLHQHGLAFDLGGSPDQLAWLGRVWNAWGGFWSDRDRVHFQVRT